MLFKNQTLPPMKNLRKCGAEIIRLSVFGIALTLSGCQTNSALPPIKVAEKNSNTSTKTQVNIDTTQHAQPKESVKNATAPKKASTNATASATTTHFKTTQPIDKTQQTTSKSNKAQTSTQPRPITAKPSQGARPSQAAKYSQAEKYSSAKNKAVTQGEVAAPKPSLAHKHNTPNIKHQPPETIEDTKPTLAILHPNKADAIDNSPTAKISPATAIASPSNTIPAPRVNLQTMPQRIDETWSLDLAQAGSSKSHCVLQSQPQTLDDGQGKTTFKMMLDEAKIRFQTASNIDLSYPNTGIVITGKTTQHIALDGIEKETTAVIQKNLPAVLSALRNAQRMDVYLGFWPTWPMTETKRISITMNNFAQAEAALAACNKLLSGD